MDNHVVLFPAGHVPRPYHEECAELRRNGGLGCASVVFAVQGMPGGTSVMLFRRWELRSPAPAAATRGYFPHWEEVAKNAANDKLYDTDLLHSINNWELPADVGSEVIQEVD
ncbi:hypothetical protein EVG20_g2285 [Dentipellis fragilis]|uniref:Uncharacterized protein n=1 Tax=Dentipellis fragilis TaxID=205917 RepID=A0A4Y9Z762_9AGAM|nr:hypothetical protein EVG20_g2285 [Dentipellis fragilis]